MKKVFQSVVCQGTGDCARAAIASLFDKELHEVPKFFPDHTQAFEIVKYFESQGHKPCFFNRREDGHLLQSGKICPTIEEVAKYDGGVGGYFYASVPSQTFDGCSHAVIVDIDLNIVHDPNPNQMALNLKPKDVVDIITVGDWHINLEGEFVRE
ncbi:MAG: hypothetical protein AABY15_02280 [Nanoarchaeota archaeon]